MHSLYSILGVSEQATEQQIKAAFRKLCMQYHPDKTGGNKALEEKFRQVLAAYEVLGNPDRKRSYDQRLAWQRTSPTASTAGHTQQRTYYQPPPQQGGRSYSFQVNIQVTGRLPKKAMWVTAAVLLAFFTLLYFFGPKPKPYFPEEVPETQVELPPIASGLFPQVADPNPMLVIPGQGEQRLKDFLAGGDTTHTFLHMDNDEVPELVAGSYLFAEKAGRYHLVFHYDGAMYVQHNRLYLYFNDLVGTYRSCYGCSVKNLPNDEPIAEIRLIYDGGRVIFPGPDKYRSIAILENLRYLFDRGVPPPDASGQDDGTRKELLRHFIAFHFNQRNGRLTRDLFEKLYDANDKDTVWADLAGMIDLLQKRITSAAAPAQ
ncbi:DnaJ domain-containing protein [Chitinophaga alhagiae]|nr:DnaJ domain-containing protein [Chitinophaga alhagiae]